ncbi:hypothetical protein Vadar_028254 [Vaccinium darrowii]|uniref:Uncharacterized protein n=1 Tax=Vaccinium darrowii TaxID=229202 RepID=A0ACB7YQR0_9ERIC|nr:hypothetical protein Vadar_028254 [Vaccinium darrowii]
MLNSTIELITLAASNSLLMFCFCNFIIAVLLVGGSKPASEYGQDSSIPPPEFAFRDTNETEGTSSTTTTTTTTTCSVDNDNASTGVSELCAVKADTVESVEEEEKENDDGDGDDDELRRRVEEFIDKINEGWKAEKLRTSLCSSGERFRRTSKASRLPRKGISLQAFVGFNMGYTANEPRTFVLKLHLHCENCAKDVKKFVQKKIKGVDSVDVIDQEEGKVRILGNVEPQTVIEKLKKHMKKHAELLVEDEEDESPPKINNQEMQIVNKPVREFVDQRKVPPLLPDPIIKPLAIEVRDCYPAHDHKLELKSFNKPFTCSRCMEDGFTSGYRCKLCVYDIHKECMNPKPKITHKLFPGSVFEFRQKPHINGSICDACGMIINGCSYRCEARNLDLHPRCSNLPGKLRIDGTDFVLICKNVEQRCFSCKMKLHSRLVEEKVPGCCYVSERNKFYCHVYCVSQMVQEAWRRGDLVPNDDDDDDDGTSKALEKVNLKLVAKSNGSGGRGGRLFLKAVTAFLKAIVGILFGDPTGLIVFAVTELLQN